MLAGWMAWLLLPAAAVSCRRRPRSALVLAPWSSHPSSPTTLPPAERAGNPGDDPLRGGDAGQVVRAAAAAVAAGPAVLRRCSCACLAQHHLPGLPAIPTSPTPARLLLPPRRFSNVCELDIMFSLETTHHIIDEMLANGCIVETNKANALTPVQLLERVA